MPTAAQFAIAERTDPGRAVGPLAMLLRHGRDDLRDELAGGDAFAIASGARPYHLALMAELASPLLVVTPRTSDAEALVDGLAGYLGEGRVALFPSWETLPHERLSPQPATVGRRLRVLDRLTRPEAHDEPLLAVVTSARAAMQPMDPALGERRPLELRLGHGGDVTFDGVVESLAELGYARVGQVESRGEFAVRGGIVDLFPTASDAAVRVEFWGDDIESLRTFGVGDQRSVDTVDVVVAHAARELVLSADLRARARSRRAGCRHSRGRSSDWPRERSSTGPSRW